MTEKVVLVTGASRGIGAAVARAAAVDGYAVAINYNSSAAAAEALVREIEGAGGRAVALQADMAVPDDAARLFEGVDQAFGRLDALVNNAGVIGPMARVADTDPADWAALWALNLTGYFTAAQHAIRRMSTALGGPGGAIVNISSVAAKTGGLPGMAAYAATKGGVDAFTIGLAKELGHEGIRVNSVRPGLIDTEIHEIYGKGAQFEAMAKTVPLAGRAGTAAEVADTVMWLLSDRSSYVSGAVIDVSGGR